IEDAQEADGREDDEEYRGRFQKRDRDLAQDRPFAEAVDACGFIEGIGNSAQARHEDDDLETEAGPDGRRHDRIETLIDRAQETLLRKAQRIQDIIDETDRRRL